MNEMIRAYLDIVEGKMKESKQVEASLIAEDRKDEANIERVRYNIYEIFVVLLNATKKASKDKESFCDNYLKKFDTIPASWRERLEQARKHQDVETVLIEETKLKVVTELRNLFKNLSGSKE
jgi:hypothetical protein